MCPPARHSRFRLLVGALLPQCKLSAGWGESGGRFALRASVFGLPPRTSGMQDTVVIHRYSGCWLPCPFLWLRRDSPHSSGGVIDSPGARVGMPVYTQFLN